MVASSSPRAPMLSPPVPHWRLAMLTSNRQRALSLVAALQPFKFASHGSSPGDLHPADPRPSHLLLRRPRARRPRRRPGRPLAATQAQGHDVPRLGALPLRRPRPQALTTPHGDAALAPRAPPNRALPPLLHRLRALHRHPPSRAPAGHAPPRRRRPGQRHRRPVGLVRRHDRRHRSLRGDQR
jgi:hypothetical protein